MSDANPVNITQDGNTVTLSRKVAYSNAIEAQERLEARLDAADSWAGMTDAQKLNFLGQAVRDLVIVNMALVDEVKRLRRQVR